VLVLTSSFSTNTNYLIMKVTAVLAALLGVAAAFPQLHTAPVDQLGAAPAPAGAAGQARQIQGGLGGMGGFPGIGVQGNPFGPKFYGMGLNNAWAIHPNPLEVAQAKHVTSLFPNTLARVDPDGEITYTNQFGMEIDLEDQFFL